MKPRIVFLNTVGSIGGAERILMAMARHLSGCRPDWSLSAVLFGQGPLEAALAELGVEVRVLPLPEDAAEMGDTQLRGRSRLARLAAMAGSALDAGPATLGHIRRLRNLMNELRPNLVHSNGLKTHLLSAFTMPRHIPLLWHIHDFYSHRPVMANLLRRLTGGVSQALAISKAVQEDLQNTLPRLPATLVYNGVDTHRFCPGAGSDLDALAGLPPAPTGTRRVGLVATYANWKGHDVFLKSVAQLPDDGTRFFIIGGPIYRTLGSQFSLPQLQSLAADLGVARRVGFVPFQPDPAGVYRALDAVVHASTRPEPFGLTIAEAMACGRAVVVADAGGAKELFTDGVDALGHVPGDAVSLAHAIGKLLGDEALRERLASNARQTALDRFSENRFGPEIESVFSRYLPALRQKAYRQGPCRISVETPIEGLPRLVLPKKIVYVNPIGGIGGAEQSLLRIFAVMRRFAPQVRLQLLAGSDGALLSRAAEMGVDVERMPLGGSLMQLGESGLLGAPQMSTRLRFLAALPQVSLQLRQTRAWLKNWLAQHQPDLIHSNGMKTHLLTALVRPARTPLFWHIRDFLSTRPLMRWNLRWLAPHATRAIANSHAVAADARSVFGRLPVTTLYNTVDTARFNTTERDGSLLDEWAGLPPAPPGTLRVGLVATYANWKGHDILLRAAAKLPSTLPVRVYLIGDPIYATPGSQFSRAQLESLAGSLGIADRVGFVPFQDDVARVYGKLDVVVHASTRPEPFGLAIAEAMASGRAVIISAAGGATELFTEGHDALGHPPGDVDALAAVLMRLLNDPDLRAKLGANARRTAEERFAEEPFARELLAIYAEALSESRG